ncbi:MAG TPA: hypothetical protein VK809_10830 [Bacteroidia bacterium]|jgi:hypothetical protein|nr:hypothetical protein [Bacteroidia bacterium]
MKKAILTIGICVVGLMGVQAQQAMPSSTATAKSGMPTKDQQVEKMITKMKSACTLTPEQTEKVKPIVTEFVSARMENKQKLGSDKDKMQAANQASMKTMNTKLATVLNADQQTKWTAAEKEMKAEMQKKAASGKK